MPHLGTTELIIIMVIVILIFGAGKLGSLGGALAKGVRDFRAAIRSDEDEEEPAPEPKKSAQASAVEDVEAGQKED